MKTLCLLIGILALSSPAYAAIKYLDNGATGGCGNPSTNYNPTTRVCGTGSDTVYTDRSDAFDNLGASNTLKIRAGTYSDQCSANTIEGGTVAAPTTFMNYPGEVVTLVASGTRSCIVNFAGDSYITFIGDNRDNFIFDGAEFLATEQIILTTDSSTNNIVMDHITVRNAQRSCIFFHGAPTSSITLRYSHVYNCGIAGDGTTNFGHGIYVATDGALIEHNEIHNIEGWAIHCFDANAPACDNSVIRYNLVYDFGQEDSSQPVQAGITVDGNNNQIYRNVIRCNAGSSDRGIDTNSLATNTLFYFNSITNCTVGIVFTTGSTGSIAKNNISYGNTTAFSGSGVTYDNNLCGSAATGCEVIGDPLFRDAANNDLSLLTGSPAIAAGVAIAGFITNGTADIGAYETISFSSCVVNNSTPSRLEITFVNDVAPPLLPATGMTTFTARKATANDVVTATNRTGDNQVFLTLTTAIVNGDAVDFSYVAGNVTESSLIGGSSNQRLFAITNQSCTNNVGAAATHTFTQAAFEFHGLRGTEAAPVGTPYETAPENSNILVHAGGAVRVRIAVTCTVADCPPTGFYPRYSKNGGAYTSVIPDIFGADGIAFLGTSPDPDIPANGTPTTDQLSTSGTFVAGAVVRTSNAIPTVDLAQNGKTELEYAITFGPTAAANATFDIRLYKQDGTPLDTYTVTPRITIFPCGMFVGF